MKDRNNEPKNVPPGSEPRIDVTFRHLKGKPGLRQTIARDLAEVAERLRIKRIAAVFSHRHESGSKVDATVHLETPGPDVVARATAPSATGAWHEVLAKVRQIARKRAGRWRENRRYGRRSGLNEGWAH